MFAIELAKLPPPKPAVAAITQKTQNGVSGRCTKNAKSSVGTSSRLALIIVQLRPPNFGTANVYGSRSSEPTRLGSATRKKSCWGVNVNPICSRSAELTLEISPTEKPRCSAKIDQIRLRRATWRPPPSQNSESSGLQSSIQWPVRRVDTPLSVAAAGGLLVRVMGAPEGFGSSHRRRRTFHSPQDAVAPRSTCPHDLTDRSSRQSGRSPIRRATRRVPRPHLCRMVRQPI